MSHIATARVGAAVHIVLARPERRNALHLAMYEAMTAALGDAANDPAVRCVVFRGEGAGFCAGNDLEDFLRHPPAGMDSPVMRFLAALAAFDKPVIAGVHGAAVGIGTTLLLHCDLAVAAEDAFFKLPFAQLGLVPEAASSLLMPGLVGSRKAFEWLVLGTPFGADDALRAGLVNRVVPAAELRDALDAYVAAVAALPPAAVRSSKRLIREATASAVPATMAREADVFAERLASDELKEAVSAFFEKRAPDFSRFP
jgi:enoyl-CoA hydratase/carnithine racemase